MTTDIEPTTDAVAEVYPWEPDTPYLPTLTATLFVVDATRVNPFDFMATSTHVVGVDIGGVTLHLGLDDPDRDAEIVRVADRLINALGELRAAAVHRIEAA